MTRADILDKAKECVCGQREQDYGKPEDNFATIAAFWSAYKDTEFSAEDVAVMMALMKIARIKTGTSTDDCFVDLAGYAACGGEIASAFSPADVGVSVFDAAKALSRFLKRDEKWKAASDKNEIRASFSTPDELSAVAFGLSGVLSAKGRITVHELGEIMANKCTDVWFVSYADEAIDKDLGWGADVNIRYTRDGGGRYILVLPYPTNLNNKEEN